MRTAGCGAAVRGSVVQHRTDSVKKKQCVFKSAKHFKMFARTNTNSDQQIEFMSYELVCDFSDPEGFSAATCTDSPSN